MKHYVIDKIIEKAEKSTVDWLEGAAGSRSFPLKEYHEKDYKKAGRSDFAGEVRELELQGLLRCRWYQRYSEASEIKYRLEDLEVFYRLSGRREKHIRISLMSAYIEELLQRTESDWIQAVFSDMLRRLQEGRIPAELKPADIFLQNPDHPVDNWEAEAGSCGLFDIFLVLEGLDKLNNPVYKRVFSSHVLKDRQSGQKTVKASKVFETFCQSTIIAMARQHHPFVEEDMDNTQVLSQIFIEEYAQELAVKGPLVIEIDGREIDLASFSYGTVLNSQTLKNGHPSLRQNIRRIITVENKANYEAMPYETGTLIIFCHGYFTPRERVFLQELYRNLKRQTDNPPMEYYHTGDLDYGGICIFRYIRSQIFPELKPLYMDVAQYEAYAGKSEELAPETLEKLKALEEPLLQPLIKRLLKEGRGIEQECFI